MSATLPNKAIHIVVMGVSGCGKTSVGLAIAAKIGARFVDGDDLHSPANRAKMNAGTPLNDQDRWPWLDSVGQTLATANGSIVVACSALKRAYRDRILAQAPDTVFVHLDGSRELLWERISARQGHFFPAALLDTQLATLEPLGKDEPGVTLSIEGDPESVALRALVSL